MADPIAIVPNVLSSHAIVATLFSAFRARRSYARQYAVTIGLQHRIPVASRQVALIALAARQHGRGDPGHPAADGGRSRSLLDNRSALVQCAHYRVLR